MSKRRKRTRKRTRTGVEGTSVAVVRQSAHQRGLFRGLTGGPVACDSCGKLVRHSKRDGEWRAVEDKGTVLPNGSEHRELHRCEGRD